MPELASRSGSPARLWLTDGWEFCATPAGSCGDPHALADRNCAWQSTRVPTTAACSLLALRQWSLDGPARRFDAEDWWFRLRLEVPAGPPRCVPVLGFDGLATVAEVWLDGQRVLESDNMHVAHQLDLPQIAAGEHQLVLHFLALDALLERRRPRPRWRAPMVEHQQLRWFRTTLLGRTPGWSPPAAAVGPWRGIWLELRTPDEPKNVVLRTSLHAGAGRTEVRGRWPEPPPADAVVALRLSGHGRTVGATLRQHDDGSFDGDLLLPEPQLWWPHTHGEPALYDLQLELRLPGAPLRTWPLGRVGFRSVELSTTGERFELSVNGVPVFCRGACWTPADPVALHSDEPALGSTLDQVVGAGMNMLRVGGTMVYETEEFYAACDARGILVWQDFMFANMDYPATDPAFAASVQCEAEQLLARLGAHASVALYCGNSEVEQQAAMWGAPREHWQPPLFHETLRALVAQHCPDTPYWPSSAHGGAFPHDASAGSTSYYGVGAYLRPLDDARRAAPRFATECLAFANVPEPDTLGRLPGGAGLRVHHAAWKQRVPRDLNAGWDFDDVRDHYLKLLTGIDPLSLRYSDHARYLDLSRIVTAEVMAATYMEWRRPGSHCGGALVWFLRDLWAGAGWGLIGADGLPKAPWYYLRRHLQPRMVGITDEGGNGLAVHLVNESATALRGSLELQVYRDGQRLVDSARIDLQLAPRSARTIAAGALFDHFVDLSHAYRFGTPGHDLVVARLRDAAGTAVAECAHLPRGLGSLVGCDPAWRARVERVADGRVMLHLVADRHAHAVTVSAPGYACDDQYFPLLPGEPRSLTLRPLPGVALPARPSAEIRALNALGMLAVEL